MKKVIAINPTKVRKVTMTKPPNALAVFLSPACEGAAVLKGLVPFFLSNPRRAGDLAS
jgi:hypothetical protein